MEAVKSLARQRVTLPEGETVTEALLDAGTEWAEQLLLRYTMGRVEEYAQQEPTPEPLVNCTAELAGLWLREQQNSGRTVVRESVGSWAKTWSAGSGDLQRRSVQVIQQWLGGVDGLLYRGLD